VLKASAIAETKSTWFTLTRPRIARRRQYYTKPSVVDTVYRASFEPNAVISDGSAHKNAKIATEAHNYTFAMQLYESRKLTAANDVIYVSNK